jgi:hypothetical protein
MINILNIIKRNSTKNLFWITFYYLKAKINKHKIFASINKKKFGKIYEKYKDASPAQGYSKYLDLHKWLEINLVRYYQVGLQKGKPLKILDIGTGCGYFPYICQFYGHKVKALDMPVVDMYNDMINLLHIDRKEYTINAYEKLPELDGKYDIVTAFSICFNGHNTENLWSVNEWEYFLNNLAINHMAEAGKVYLSFNAEADGMFFDSDVCQYFRDIDAKIEDQTVVIDNLNLLRTQKLV